MNKYRLLSPVVILTLGLASSALRALESRQWLSSTGGTMEAELVRVDGEKVILKNKEGREVTVAKIQLSIADNRYLAEFAPKAANTLGQGNIKPVLPNPGKDVKIDQKTFVKVKDKQFTIPECKFDILETPHFLVLYPNKVESTDIGETAERIWLDAAFFHPGFAQKFKDRRMAIFMVEEQDTWENIGEWYAKMIETSSAPNAADAANRIRATWKQAASGAINLTQEIADEHGVLRHARVFRTTTGVGSEKRKEKIKGVFVPFRLHCLASDMMDIDTSGVQGFGSDGLFAISTGHAYYKEILLGGRSETSMLSAGGTDNAVSSAGGFDPSKNWADEIKKQLRGSKPVLVPDIMQLYKVKGQGADQKSNVLAYGFSRYLQGNPDRAIIYAKLIEKIDTGSQIPDALELAKMYGFDDVAAMQADWIAYMKSPEFK